MFGPEGVGVGGREMERGAVSVCRGVMGCADAGVAVKG